MLHMMLGELVPVLISYKFPQILFMLTVGFIIWKYLVPKMKKKADPKVRDAVGDFVPVPAGADDEDEVGARQQSINADIQDMRMQRKIRQRAGWKARSWTDSELMAPKSRRWDGIDQQ